MLEAEEHQIIIVSSGKACKRDFSRMFWGPELSQTVGISGGQAQADSACGLNGGLLPRLDI